MKTVIVCDVDKTIADGSHRKYLLKEYCARCGGAAKVEGYYECANCDYTVFKIPQSSYVDYANPALLALDQPLYKAQEVLAKAASRCDIHYITARSKDSREVTEEWLTKYFGFDPKVNKLLTREENSYTDRKGVTHLPASIHKRSCLAELMKQCGYSGKELFLFFEDNLESIDMYAEYGIVFKAPECWDTIVTLPYNSPDFLYAR